MNLLSSFRRVGGTLKTSAQAFAISLFRDTLSVSTGVEHGPKSRCERSQLPPRRCASRIGHAMVATWHSAPSQPIVLDRDRGSVVGEAVGGRGVVGGELDGGVDSKATVGGCA